MEIEEDELQLLATEQMNRLKGRIKRFLDTHFAKPYILDCRVKSIEKLKLKQALFSQKYGYSVKLTDLPDIVGFRISVENEEDVEEVSELVKGFLSPSGVNDHFNNPGENGFKGFVYFFEVFGLNTEIQVMTTRMMEWTNATHDEHNKRKYGI